MLILSRKPGEAIVVPNRELTITVVSVEGKIARHGICTPDVIDVYRNTTKSGRASAMRPIGPLPSPERKGREHR